MASSLIRPNPASAGRADPQQPFAPAAELSAHIDDLLPQTQCRRCGFDGCLPYAQAMSRNDAPINRCPPGGEAVIAALGRLLGTPPIALDPSCGQVRFRRVAAIDNDACIGCTKCILACPVDAIVGGPKHQHHVLSDRCTGCELCVPPCPVDCISMETVGQDWSEADAQRGRRHHRARLERLTRLGRQSAGTVEAVLSAPAEKARRLDAILKRARGGSTP